MNRFYHLTRFLILLILIAWLPDVSFGFPGDRVKLAGACWQLGVWSQPRTGYAAGCDDCNMYWIAEEVSLMYDAGLVVGYSDDTTQTFFSAQNTPTDNYAFQAASMLEITDFGTYKHAIGEFISPDSALCGTSEYFLPQQPSLCAVIEKYELCNCSGEEQTINIGYTVDWDIPDGSGGFDNRGGFDPERRMFYQRGPGLGGIEDVYFGGVAFCGDAQAGKLLENDIWIIPNDGYVAAEIGGFMEKVLGFTATDSIEDLHAFYLFQEDITLSPGECISFCVTKASSLTGLPELQTLIDDAKEWAAMEEIGCDGDCSLDPAPCATWGDANGSGSVDIDDTVYLLNYIFKNGPPPAYDDCCGDANGSGYVDIDDVVFTIAYIFGGGPGPVQVSC